MGQKDGSQMRVPFGLDEHGNADRDDVAHGAASRGSIVFPNILPHARVRCNLTFAFFAVKMKLAAPLRPDLKILR